MKIASSDIAMKSARAFVEKEEKHERLRAWWGGSPGGPPGAPSPGSPPSPGPDRLTLSEDARRLGLRQAPSGLEEGKKASAGEEDEAGLDEKLRIMKAMVEYLMGEEIQVFDPSELTEKPEGSREGGGEGDSREGWGFEYRSVERHYEAEQTVFQAQGVIKTQDGREIDFTLDLQMSREHFSEKTTEILAGDAAKTVDPLVINFDGNAAELTSMKFAFDLDADSKEENVSFVKPGSGFLALDANGDGVINDGSELFGPRTGNGFGELAAYDEDGNSWIDENDSVYDRLSVWTKDGAGNDALRGLKGTGVGAIHLSYADTPFHVKDAGNELQGEVKRTSVYVEEDGNVGTVQQVDLAV